MLKWPTNYLEDYAGDWAQIGLYVQPFQDKESENMSIYQAFYQDKRRASKFCLWL